jgi:myb proto-oncogene protein
MINNEQKQFKCSRKHQNERHFFTEEDTILLNIMNTHKHRRWKEVSAYIPGRLPRQCRDRWHNYLAPWIKKREWTHEEDEIIKRKVAEIGTKWTQIRRMLHGRADNDIKNRWHTCLSKERDEKFTNFDFWDEIESASIDFDFDFNLKF